MRLEILPCDLKLRVRLWGVGPRTSCFVSLPEGCDAFFPSRSLIPESQSHDPSHSQRPSPFIQNRRTYLLSPLVFKRVFSYRKFWSQFPLTHLLPGLPPHLWFTLVCFLLPRLSPHPNPTPTTLLFRQAFPQPNDKFFEGHMATCCSCSGEINLCLYCRGSFIGPFIKRTDLLSYI